MGYRGRHRLGMARRPRSGPGWIRLSARSPFLAHDAEVLLVVGDSVSYRDVNDAEVLTVTYRGA